MSIGDLESYVVKWKDGIGRMAVIATIVTKDRVHSYWSMMPATIQEYLLNKGFGANPWRDIDKMELEVESYIRRHKQKNSFQIDANILGVVGAPHESSEKEEVLWQWCGHHQKLIGMAVQGSAKRPRTEESSMDADASMLDAVDPKGGKSGGKTGGKPHKKGPEKGCWNCGGDH